MSTRDGEPKDGYGWFYKPIIKQLERLIESPQTEKKMAEVNSAEPFTNVFLNRFKHLEDGEEKPLSYRVALCPCHEDGADPIWEVALDDTGYWSIECLECGEAISFKDLMEKFK